MKKIAIVIVAILSFVVSAYAAKGPEELITSKKSDIDYSKFAKISPVSVLVTFENTKFWGSTLDEWVAKEEEKGKTGVREELITKFFKSFDKDVSKGKKWKIKRITDKAEATEGYLFKLNVNSIVPVPGLGTKCDVTVTAVDVGAGSDLLDGYMECFQMSATGIPAPKISFAESGARVLDKLMKFLKACE